jgi:hypothetical protein
MRSTNVNTIFYGNHSQTATIKTFLKSSVETSSSIEWYIGNQLYSVEIKKQ